jgi:hypothetical protein
VPLDAEELAAKEAKTLQTLLPLLQPKPLVHSR